MEEYRLNDTRYAFSYKDLKSQFERYERMSDSKFLADLPNILHFTVFVCWFKQLQARDVLSDQGLIHELVHLLCIDDYDKALDSEGDRSLQFIRKMFNETCRLV